MAWEEKLTIDGRTGFINYLKKTREQRPRGRRGQGRILVQIVHQPRVHIVLARFLPLLKSHYSATAVATDKVISGTSRHFLRAIWRTGSDWTLNLSTFGVYRALGCEQALVPRASARVRKAAKNFSHRFLASTPTKAELEQLCIDGVQVGDLVYDSFLRIGHPTIDFEDKGLSELLAQAYLQVTYWRNLLNPAVAAVIADSVYLNAVLARVAIDYAIPVYSVGEQALYRLDKSHPLPEREDRWFLQISERLAWAKNEKILTEGQHFIQRRLEGRIDHRIGYMKTSPYTHESIDQPPSLTTPSVLVAAHDFFDSPHVFGAGFYPDFFEWCTALDEIARASKLPWLVKPHPRSSELSIDLIRDIFGSNLNCTIVSPSASTQSLVRNGVRFVTTVYGTIASELPLLGVTSIVASSNHKYAGLGFGPSFEDRFEYENALSEVQNCDFKIEPASFFLFHFFDGVKSREWQFLSGFWERFDANCVYRGVHPYQTYGETFGVQDEVDLTGLDTCLVVFLEGDLYRTNWDFQ